MSPSPPYLVGITGGSGSGKTTFTSRLAERLGEKATVLTLDNYYYPLERQPLDENGIPNFDQPDSLNLLQFADDVQKLKNGQSIVQKEYTFNHPTRIPKLITIYPAPVILIEGLYVFHLPAVDQLIDLKLFIEVDVALKISRRVKRDVHERGYKEEDILYSYQQHVLPSFHDHIVQHKKQAHLIVPNYSGFEKCLELVALYLKGKIR